MKKLLFIASLCLVAFTGCEKTSSASPGSSIASTPLTGNWKMIYYSKEEVLLTADYAEYTFDFKPKEAVTATINGSTLNGYWSVSALGTDRIFSMAFNNGDNKLFALNNDWEVLSVTETEVRLADNEKHEQLYFARQ